MAVSALLVSALLVSGLGSTTAGRSTYFGASAACGASAVFDMGAGVAFVSTPPSEGSDHQPARRRMPKQILQ
ncbi:hypothetical protein ACF1BQ_042695 [Bradyrhizobium sp. RDT10]